MNYVNYGAMWCDVECCNFRHGVIEMQNVRCGMECVVLVCGMLHNAKCDVKCGGEECGICNVLCDCGVICGK